MSENKNSIHPLVATAAGAVILASLVGVAAMTGLLPNKNQAPSEMPSSVPMADVPASAASASITETVVEAPVAASTPVVVQSKPKPAVKAVEKALVHREDMPVDKPAPVERVICFSCGTVESVTSREEKAEKGSGVGAIAGALLGGVIGNQVGGGNGRKLATVAGAVGGGMAGNEIEKRKNSHVLYEVTVRMENGEIRTFKPKNAPEWRNGDKVKVVDGQLTYQ